jgi:outer membrane protein TolC
MGEHLETARGPQSSRFGISQEIPGFGRRGLAGDVAKREAESAVHSVLAFELELAAEVREVAAELRYLDVARRIRTEDQALLAHLRSAAGIRYETGSGRLEDVARIEVELGRSEQALLALDRDREIAGAELNRLLGRPPTSPLPELGAGPGAEDAAAAADAAADTLSPFAAGPSERPELRAAEAEVAASDAARRLAGRRNVPDFMLGFEYYVVEPGDSVSPEAGTDAWMIEVGVRLPIWRSGIGADADAAAARQAESRATRAAEEARIAAEVQAAASRVRRGREILALYSTTLIPRAETGLASARANYQTGRSDLRDLLDAARMRVEAELDGARAAADVAQAEAHLDRALARPLPRGEEP